MNDQTTDRPDVGQDAGQDRLMQALPYLRRHARALTGSQATGDRYAIATLEVLLADGFGAAEKKRPEIPLFRAFYRVWQSSGEQLVAQEDDGPRAEAMRHLSRLTPRTREALLLHSVEGFPASDIAEIMGIPTSEVESLIDIARDEMHQSVQGRVLIIEDEPVIAMDLEALVMDMGHEVSAMAATHSDAVRKARSDPPDLVLADIQLADNSSGLEAVNELLQDFPDLPVIFITAFPERLLTGTRPEPSFLIAKPFNPSQVVTAISQAMFFASTRTIAG